jgi:hypothetical protein
VLDDILVHEHPTVDDLGVTSSPRASSSPPYAPSAAIYAAIAPPPSPTVTQTRRNCPSENRISSLRSVKPAPVEDLDALVLAADVVEA